MGRWSATFIGVRFLRELKTLLGEGAALRFFSSEEVSGLEVAFDLKPVIIDFLETKSQRQKLWTDSWLHASSYEDFR